MWEWGGHDMAPAAALSPTPHWQRKEAGGGGWLREGTRASQWPPYLERDPTGRDVHCITSALSWKCRPPLSGNLEITGKRQALTSPRADAANLLVSVCVAAYAMRPGMCPWYVCVRSHLLGSHVHGTLSIVKYTRHNVYRPDQG